MKTWIKAAIATLVVLTVKPAFAQTEVDLSQITNNGQAINATLKMPGQSNVEFEVGKYIITSPDNFGLVIEKAFDGTLNTQRDIDFAIFEVTQIVEETENSVLYRSPSEPPGYRFLVFTQVNGEGVFCRLYGNTVSQEVAKKAIAACLTLAPKP